MDGRRAVVPAAAVVIGAVVVVLLGAVGSVVAWAAVVLVAVLAGVVAAFVTVPLTAARILVGVGLLLALAALGLAIVLAVRGHRSDTSTLVLVLAGGLGALVVVVGLLGGTQRPLRALEDRIAAGAAVLGLLAGLIVVLVVPFTPQLRSTTSDQVDAAPQLVLRTPDGTREGDLLVAQVFHRGGGELRAPAGWDRVLTTPVSPDGSDGVELFTTRSTGGADEPVPFVTDAPGGKVGGIVAWSHVASAAVAAQRSGAALPVAGPEVAADDETPILSFVSLAGTSQVPPPDELAEAWQTASGGDFPATVALLVREPQQAGTQGPISVTPAAGATGPWALQVLALSPE